MRNLRKLRLALLFVGATVAVALAWRAGNPGDSGGPTRAPGPTFNLPAALDSQIDDAGLTRSGAIWAVQGSYVMTSSDKGESWRADVIPAPARSVFALDQDHIWAIVPATSVTSVGPAAASSPVPTTRAFVVARTADGGKRWGLAPVPGSFGCDAQSFSFVDADWGYLLCSGSGTGTVLETQDGGATWDVQSQTTGLGPLFTASDATTLWAAPGFGSGDVAASGGAPLQVSHDGGRSWSRVELPELSGIPSGSVVSVAAGPVFRDASNGAFALGVTPGDSAAAAVWFYRSADAGKSWTLTKRERTLPLAEGVANALVGKVWAALGNDQFGGLAVSGDFGATWRDAPAYGLPAHGVLAWVDFTDASHAVGWVSTVGGSTSGRALMLSSDGAATWHAADFGDARAKVGPNAAQDPIAAAATVLSFATASETEPQAAWRQLSSFTQRAYGGYDAFAAAEGARYKRAGLAFQIAPPTQSVVVRNRVSLGPTLWDDMANFSDMSRAYVVVVSFAGTDEPPVTLVAAPLAITGDWRVWVAKVP
ncbi:MAG TPA: sialidase family protein [Candidatus Limnocylindrales bacterium]